MLLAEEPGELVYALTSAGDRHDRAHLDRAVTAPTGASPPSSIASSIESTSTGSSRRAAPSSPRTARPWRASRRLAGARSSRSTSAGARSRRRRRRCRGAPGCTAPYSFESAPRSSSLSDCQSCSSRGSGACTARRASFSGWLQDVRRTGRARIDTLDQAAQEGERAGLVEQLVQVAALRALHAGGAAVARTGSRRASPPCRRPSPRTARSRARRCRRRRHGRRRRRRSARPCLEVEVRREAADVPAVAHRPERQERDQRVLGGVQRSEQLRHRARAPRAAAARGRTRPPRSRTSSAAGRAGRSRSSSRPRLPSAGRRRPAPSPRRGRRRARARAAARRAAAPRSAVVVSFFDLRVPVAGERLDERARAR